jgi:riboflavin kinase/FMN adenylyltransferase
MKYYQDTFDFSIDEPCVISLGKFDGLHTGHKRLMEQMKKEKENGCRSVAITFSVPPRALESGSYKVLSTNEEKKAIFEKAGIDVLIELPFTEQLKHMPPYDFLRMLNDRINIRVIVVGTDFRFGSGRQGSYLTLQNYEKEFGYTCRVVEKLQYQQRDISSTRIRELIERGAMEETNLLLGYPYFLRGTVVHGEGLGHTKGMPTINMIPPKDKLLPPAGVYASTVEIDRKVYRGISNIGYKPTVGEFPVGVETHLFDYSGSLYGRTLDVCFHHFLRPEQKFSSLDSLMEQIHKDIDACQEILDNFFL